MACPVELSQCLMPSALRTTPGPGDSMAFQETGYASTGFLLICSAMVMIMTPGVGLLYSGFVRTYSHHLPPPTLNPLRVFYSGTVGTPNHCSLTSFIAADSHRT